MAVPRNRHSIARRNSRRAHDAKTPKLFASCQNCKSSVLPHCICQSCGYYKGRSYKTRETEA
jgi:large subunit ribosomal protein L32